jgi:hypothetical protein
MDFNLEVAADARTAPSLLTEYFKAAFKNYHDKSNDAPIYRYGSDKVLKILAKNPNTPTDTLMRLFHLFPEDVYDNPVFSLLMLENPDMVRGWLRLCPSESSLLNKAFAPEFEDNIIVKCGNGWLWRQQILNNLISQRGLLKMIEILDSGKRGISNEFMNVIMQYNKLPPEFIGKVLSRNNLSLDSLFTAMCRYVRYDEADKEKVKCFLSPKAKVNLGKHEFLPDYIDMVEKAIESSRFRKTFYSSKTRYPAYTCYPDHYDKSMLRDPENKEYLDSFIISVKGMTRAAFSDHICVVSTTPERRIRHILAYDRKTRIPVYANFASWMKPSATGTYPEGVCRPC